MTGDLSRAGALAGRRNRRVKWLAIAAFVLLLAAVAWWWISQRAAQPRYGITLDAPAAVADFTLMSTLGHPVSLYDYSDKHVVLYFGYTTCPDICPTTLGDLKQAMARLGDQAAQVQVFFVTVDPERDTPERMAGYLQFFDPSFVGLTGSQEEIEAIATRFGIFFEKRSGATAADYLMDHTSTVLVLDPGHRLRLMFPFGLTGEQMANDLRALMR